jgi:hypothetical protein
MKINEELLMAFADGELEGDERYEVEQALAEDPELRAALEEQQRLRAALTGHYGPVAQEEVPERLLAMLGAGKAEGVVALSAVREKRRSAFPLWQKYGALAASLAVGIIAGQLLPYGGTGPVASQDGTLIARGNLASALETQLASTQNASSETHIGLTFPDRQGRFCRTFDAQDVSGLACRADGKWKVVLAAAGERQGSQYRQAGSPSVLHAAQEIMGAPPLDAEAERKALEAGWKISAAAD